MKVVIFHDTSSAHPFRTHPQNIFAGTGLSVEVLPAGFLQSDIRAPEF